MNGDALRAALRTTKALADPQRLRILMMLRLGELCVCQIVGVLGLAPSTVSKHLSILSAAELVLLRREGRWSYYRLPNPDEVQTTQPVLDWVGEELSGDEQILADRKELALVTACDPETLCRRQRAELPRPRFSTTEK